MRPAQSARVRVRVELEITADDVWSADTSIEQAQAQGLAGCMKKLADLLHVGPQNGIRVVSQPKVVEIVTRLVED